MEKIDSLINKLELILQPWRSYLIAIDGRDGVGKSPIGRRLALELKVPLIETDLYLKNSCSSPDYHLEELLRVLEARINKNRPVIVEGVFIRKTLDRIGLSPDCVIYVSSINHSGSFTWLDLYTEYEAIFTPSSADFSIECSWH